VPSTLYTVLVYTNKCYTEFHSNDLPFNNPPPVTDKLACKVQELKVNALVATSVFCWDSNLSIVSSTTRLRLNDFYTEKSTKHEENLSSGVPRLAILYLY